MHPDLGKLPQRIQRLRLRQILGSLVQLPCACGPASLKASNPNVEEGAESLHKPSCFLPVNRGAKEAAGHEGDGIAFPGRPILSCKGGTSAQACCTGLPALQHGQCAQCGEHSPVHRIQPTTKETAGYRVTMHIPYGLPSSHMSPLLRVVCRVKVDDHPLRCTDQIRGRQEAERAKTKRQRTTTDHNGPQRTTTDHNGHNQATRKPRESHKSSSSIR